MYLSIYLSELSVWSAQYIISYILFVPDLLIKAALFALYDMACDFKGRINCRSRFPCNLTRVVSFWKKKIYIYKCRSESRTSYNLHVKRLSNTLTFSFSRLWCSYFFLRLWFKLFKDKRKTQRL